MALPRPTPRRAPGWPGVLSALASPFHLLAAALERRLGAGGHVDLLAALTRLRARPWRARQQRRLRASRLHLNHFDARTYSQNGEDGILEEIFRRVGTSDQSFVEVGAGDGSENCTRRLAEEEGWRGVWIEGDEDAAQRARAAAPTERVIVVEQQVDTATILPLLREAGVAAEPDLLVIDIDGNDYWLWRAIATAHRPRVVVIEYNASFPPGRRWVLPYDPLHRWDGSRAFGASLESLVDLGGVLGYRLVACDARGVNAFFVREDVASGATFIGSGQAREHYWPPSFGAPYFGHPPQRVPPPTRTSASAHRRRSWSTN